MEAPRSRRDPDLAVRRLPVDDDARGVRAGDRQDSRLEINVEAPACLDGPLDAREHRIDSAMEIALVHNAEMIRALACLAAIACAIAIAGCGQKGPLKLPEPPPAKPAPAAP